MDNLLKSLRFMPTDEELILHYLKPFCNNQPLPMNKIVEVNLYDFSPHELKGKYEKLNSKEWYFFTPREKRYPGGKRTSRVTKNNGGFWKITGGRKVITVTGEVIGKRSCLVYYKAKGHKTNWIMYEYTYEQQQSINTSTTKLDKALCKIHENPERKKKTIQVVAEEAVHVFMNLSLHSNHEQQQQQQQIDQTLLWVNQYQLHQLQQQQLRFLNTTFNLNQTQQQQQQVDEEEDVGDQVLKLLDLDEEELHQQQQQQQQNQTLDSNQKQQQQQQQVDEEEEDVGDQVMRLLDLEEQELQETLLNPKLDSNQQQNQQEPQEQSQQQQVDDEEEEDVGDEVLKLLDLDEEERQEQEQNLTPDSKQQQEQRNYSELYNNDYF